MLKRTAILDIKRQSLKGFTEFLNQKKEITTFKLLYKKHEYKEALRVYVSDFERYYHSDTQNKFVLLPVIPSKLQDYQLYNYYKVLEKRDIDTLDLVHFGLVKNEMIKRGFLNEISINLNLYNDNSLFEVEEPMEYNTFMTFTPAIEYDLNIPYALVKSEILPISNYEIISIDKLILFM